jgi:outer membrane protein OmpA-like peptidoglycan-associated protein
MRLKLFAISVVFLLTLSQSLDVRAQSSDITAFQVQQFRPWGDPSGMWQTQSGTTLGQWNYSVGLFLNYGNAPLVLRNADGSTFAGLLNHQIGADIVAGIGLLSFLDVYLAIPLTIYQMGEFPNNSNIFPNDAGRSLAGFFLSDIKLGLKFGILREKDHFVSLSAKAFIGFPTAQLDPERKKFSGEDSISAGAYLQLSKQISIVNLALNFGYRYNPETKLLNLTVGHELFYSLAADIEVVTRKLSVIIDIFGANALQDVSLRSVPLEIDLGLRFYPLYTRNLALNLGVGLPFTPGYGAPLFRVLFGVLWSPRDKDTDGDGLYDFEDKCPTEPGPRENLGCPVKDRDGDGVPDDQDRCPDTPGPKENQGCPWPDRDGDGISDREDRCPDTPGPKENQGCPWPDRDGDGVPDKDDQCPDTPGPKENQGCPWPDRDGDGIPDKDDKCPDTPGPQENQGCPWPDRDGDGVPDKDDKCPDEPGPKDNEGCPLAVKKQKKIEILRKVFFDFNKDTIKQESYPVLDAVSEILNKYPRIHIRVEGHTDDVGRAAYNLQLSKRRAAAVMRYLQGKGIARRRITSEGYGYRRPLTRERTAEARANNRRVEFIITRQ